MPLTLRGRSLRAEFLCFSLRAGQGEIAILSRKRGILSLDNCGLSLYTINVVVSDVMPLRRFSATTPARFEAPYRNAHKSNPVQRCKENFFIGFKAGMLLKTRENRTKCTNFERLFSEKCTGFGIFKTNWTGFARFKEPVYATMCMKKQGVIGNLMDLPEIVCY